MNRILKKVTRKYDGEIDERFISKRMKKIARIEGKKAQKRKNKQKNKNTVDSNKTSVSPCYNLSKMWEVNLKIRAK